MNSCRNFSMGVVRGVDFFREIPAVSVRVEELMETTLLRLAVGDIALGAARLFGGIMIALFLLLSK